MDSSKITRKSPSKFNFGPIFIALAAFLWTTDALARGFLSQNVNAFHLVLLEHTIIILALLPMFLKNYKEVKELSREEWIAILFIGIGGSSLATIALTKGYSFGYIAIVALLQQTQPLVAITFAHLYLKERLPKYYYPLAASAIFGVFLIFFPFVTNFTNDITQLFHLIFTLDKTGVTAGLLGLTAAVLWGGSTVFGRYLMRHGKNKISYQNMTLLRFYVAFLFLVVLNTGLMLFGNIPMLNLTVFFSVENISALFFIALFPGLLSLVLYYYGLKTTHASVATLYELTFPLTALVLIPLIFKEYISPIQIIGSLILVFATTILSFYYAKQEHDTFEITA